ncbi:MAG: aminotransferase class V-fold PLP-dependent enzyme [Lentisphaerae bacterium]|nr:aminotransferase class V-fold PLP-dependent enzyme [Lentisphaerota bacterium]
MRRREFSKTLAAGLVATGLLPRSAAAVSDALKSFTRGLGSPGSPRYWARIRRQFLLAPGLIHLNCGSLGSTPRLVLDAVAEFMRELERHPVHQVWGPMGRMAEEARATAAAFLGANGDEVTITRNTTEGMNTVASGLRLKAGDEILTTNHEHHGGLSCWEHLVERDGARIVQVKMPVPVRGKADILERIADKITPRTRVCSVSHVETITGLRMPLADIAKLVGPRGILLVCDGAQAPGMLSVNVKELGVDTYASSSHKWMLAPKGSGLLYIRKEARDRIKPMSLRAGMGVYSASSGTRNIPHILGHGVAMDFHNTIGRGRVEARCLHLCSMLRRELETIEWLEPITPQQAELSSGMVTYRVKKGRSEDLVRELETRHSIVVKRVPTTLVMDKSMQSEDYNAIRFSTHVFNSEEEVERVVKTVARASWS